jgi:anti-sigma factor RsiW
MGQQSHVPLEQIIALAAGRLSHEEAERVRAQIQGLPQAAAELAWYEEVIALARDTSAEDAPEHLIQRALRIGRPRSEPPAPHLFQRVIATLRADSAQAPLGFGVRSGQPNVRQLLFAAGDRDLAIQITKGRVHWQVSGQVLGVDEAGSIELRGQKGAYRARLNAVSEFALQTVKVGKYTLVVRQGRYEIVVPGLEVGPFAPQD